MNTRIEFDVSHFVQAIGFIHAHMRAKSLPVMQQVADRFEEDALNVPPKCPKRFGGLAEAHETYVEQRIDGVTAAVLHVRKPFARALHEGVTGPNLVPVRHWTDPESGPKWVESKMHRFYQTYFEIAAGVLT